jgi:hypothetical protein
MSKQTYAVGDRVEKMCAVCKEERGHVVASVNKRGQISRVDCPKCRTRSTFKSGAELKGGTHAGKADPTYDRTRTYRAGQMMTHPTYGVGEVTAIVEPQKIDVLFSDRMRRLIHGRV